MRARETSAPLTGDRYASFLMKRVAESSEMLPQNGRSRWTHGFVRPLMTAKNDE